MIKIGFCRNAQMRSLVPGNVLAILAEQDNPLVMGTLAIIALAGMIFIIPGKERYLRVIRMVKPRPR